MGLEQLDIVEAFSTNNLVGIITLSVFGSLVLLYVLYRIIKHWCRARRNNAMHVNFIQP